MIYKIEATSEQLEKLYLVFNNCKSEIKNNQLVIDIDDEDYKFTIAIFSMIRTCLKQPVSIDYMTRDLIKFIVL